MASGGTNILFCCLLSIVVLQRGSKVADEDRD